jgi:AraC family transcriptional regulator of arabinose operon
MNALERLILRCFQRQPISNRHAHDPRINAVCDYLNAHIAQEVKIETLAMVFISPSRLAHLFKNELGQTVCMAGNAAHQPRQVAYSEHLAPT